MEVASSESQGWRRSYVLSSTTYERKTATREITGSKRIMEGYDSGKSKVTNIMKYRFLPELHDQISAISVSAFFVELHAIPNTHCRSIEISIHASLINIP